MTTSGPASSGPAVSRKKIWGIALLATALIVIFVRRYLSADEFDWDLFRKTFVNLEPYWFTLSLVLSMLSYYCRALRWEAMLRPAAPEASVWRIFESTVMGFTAIVVLGSAGEVVRPYLISVREKTTVSAQIGIWLLERIYDFLAVLLLFAWGLSRIDASTAQAGPILGWLFRNGGMLVIGLTVLCLGVLFVLRQYAEGAQARINDGLEAFSDPLRQKLSLAIESFVAGIAVTRDNRLLVETVFYTILEWVLFTATYWALFESFHLVDFSLVDVIILMGFLAFAGVVQIPGVGGGVQVVSILVLTELFHVPVEAATGMAIFVWIVSFVVVVPFGFAFAARAGISFRKLRELRDLESSENV